MKELNKILEKIKTKVNEGKILGKVLPRTPEIVEKINLETQFLDLIYKGRKIRTIDRVFCLINSITSKDQLPICKYCNKVPCLFNQGKEGFSEVCSQTCGVRYGGTKNGDPEVSKKAAVIRKKTVKEKYGVNHISQIEEVKEKKKETAIKNHGSLKAAYYDTAQETIKKVYNVDNISQIEKCKEKKKETSRKNYGTDYPWQSEKGKKDQKKGVIDKYGVDNISQLDETKEKKEKTFLKNYGEINIFKTEAFKKEIPNILLKKYGITNISKLASFRQNRKEEMISGKAAWMSTLVKNPSKPQIQLFHLCQELFPYPVLNYPACGKSIDIAVPQLSLAIEYDGSYWHQDREYDLKRQKLLEEEGWIFLRYVDYVPKKEELLKDALEII